MDENLNECPEVRILKDEDMGNPQTARGLVEWLEGYCTEHWTLKNSHLRDNCEQCWEQLRQNIEQGEVQL